MFIKGRSMWNTKEIYDGRYIADKNGGIDDISEA